MKELKFFLLIGVCFTFPSFGQVKVDTLYYDKDWKIVDSPIFADYYRIMMHSDDNISAKPFRDFYITGELQAEGKYISIDTNDDSKSIWDGEHTIYYKSGKVMKKRNYKDGKMEGEYVDYKEDGQIIIHTYLKNGECNGIYTEFTDDGMCIQIEYKDGKPMYDYYVVSNKDGFCSKIKFSDDKPLYESPSLWEKRTEYKNGVNWSYYDKNGITVGTTFSKVKDYGKYYKVNIIVANYSMTKIDFNPKNITATIATEKDGTKPLKVWSAAEYMKKVKRKQNASMVMNGIAQGLAAANAGYSTSRTTSSYSGRSSSYGSGSAFGTHGSAYGSYSGGSSYSGHSSSTTVSYDAAAAYQASVIASGAVAAYDHALLTDRQIKEQGYLKITTVHPGDVIEGYVNVQRKKGYTLVVNININGATYSFPVKLRNKRPERPQYEYTNAATNGSAG